MMIIFHIIIFALLLCVLPHGESNMIHAAAFGSVVGDDVCEDAFVVTPNITTTILNADIVSGTNFVYYASPFYHYYFTRIVIIYPHDPLSLPRVGVSEQCSGGPLDYDSSASPSTPGLPAIRALSYTNYTAYYFKVEGVSDFTVQICPLGLCSPDLFCPNMCGLSGFCDVATGRCTCTFDRTGDDCSTLLASNPSEYIVSKKAFVAFSYYILPMGASVALISTIIIIMNGYYKQSYSASALALYLLSLLILVACVFPSVAFTLYTVRRVRDYISVHKRRTIVALCIIEIIVALLVPCTIWIYREVIMPSFSSPPYGFGGDYRDYQSCRMSFSGSSEYYPGYYHFLCSRNVHAKIWCGWISIVIYYGVELLVGATRIILLRSIKQGSSSPAQDTI
eukprot:TRINITY_DN2787_c0_g1_i4.p1 TRINITY_DN2787_c0_g1~~TRINITY_DN2787_c0_g1_i4.p1  ORF type:complete len:394 (+),score=35.62 TRINITY_DN2787_c0_g1_i4:76-1257(+)